MMDRRKRTFLILGIIFVVGMGALLLLQDYQHELIYSIVVEALIEKAPPEAADTIRSEFQAARRRAIAEGKEDLLLTRLIRFSQRIEKVQRLEQAQVDRMIVEIRGFDQPEVVE